MINEKQKAFARKYIEYGNASKAYKEVYSSNNSMQVIYNESSKLLKNDEIKQYIEDIRKSLEKETIKTVMLDRQKKKELIMQRIEYCQSINDDTAISRYLDILNKMDAEYIQKTETTNTTTVLSGLDTDTLKQFVK